MMRRFVPAGVIAAVCTANTEASAFAQTIEVVGVDGKRVSVSLATLERRTVLTQDRGLRTIFQGVALRGVLIKAGMPVEPLRGPAMARQVSTIELRQLK